VGEKKLADYGQAFVDAITRYCLQNQVATDEAS
jgi:hypothetical protein